MVQSLPEKGETMVSAELLEILRCPNCVREKDGNLTFYKDTWLICQDCSRKYPIVDDIPVMLIDEGDKWTQTPQESLPIPPPAK
ncbi:MAG: hypothetical protein JNK81_06790 [Anaerolineales bacterium]|nr:hypothetical protein [Anaerolineales bacterium]